MEPLALMTTAYLVKRCGSQTFLVMTPRQLCLAKAGTAGALASPAARIIAAGINLVFMSAPFSCHSLAAASAGAPLFDTAIARARPAPVFAMR
jgi:hypothetical protein